MNKCEPDSNGFAMVDDTSDDVVVVGSGLGDTILLLKDLTRVLLGLIRSVGVVKVSLVALSKKNQHLSGGFDVLHWSIPPITLPGFDMMGNRWMDREF